MRGANFSNSRAADVSTDQTATFVPGGFKDVVVDQRILCMGERTVVESQLAPHSGPQGSLLLENRGHDGREG